MLELPRPFALLSKCVLTGVVLGVLIGATVYPVRMMATDPDAEHMPGKVEARYKRIGIPFGVGIGGAAGVVVFLIVRWRGLAGQFRGSSV